VADVQESQTAAPPPETQEQQPEQQPEQQQEQQPEQQQEQQQEQEQEQEQEQGQEQQQEQQQQQQQPPEQKKAEQKPEQRPEKQPEQQETLQNTPQDVLQQTQTPQQTPQQSQQQVPQQSPKQAPQQSPTQAAQQRPRQVPQKSPEQVQQQPQPIPQQPPEQSPPPPQPVPSQQQQQQQQQQQVETEMEAPPAQAKEQQATPVAASSAQEMQAQDDAMGLAEAHEPLEAQGVDAAKKLKGDADVELTPASAPEQKTKKLAESASTSSAAQLPAQAAEADKKADAGDTKATETEKAMLFHAIRDDFNASCTTYHSTRQSARSSAESLTKQFQICSELQGLRSHLTQELARLQAEPAIADILQGPRKEVIASLSTHDTATDKIKISSTESHQQRERMTELRMAQANASTQRRKEVAEEMQEAAAASREAAWKLTAVLGATAAAISDAQSEMQVAAGGAQLQQLRHAEVPELGLLREEAQRGGDIPREMLLAALQAVRKSSKGLRQERKEMEKSVVALKQEIEALTQKAVRDRRSAAATQAICQQLEKAQAEVQNLHWQQLPQLDDQDGAVTQDMLLGSFRLLEKLKESRQSLQKKVENAIMSVDKSKLVHMTRFCSKQELSSLAKSEVSSNDFVGLTAAAVQKEIVQDGRWIQPFEDSDAKLQAGKAKAQGLQAEVVAMQNLLSTARMRTEQLQTRLRQERQMATDLEKQYQERVSESQKLSAKLARARKPTADLGTELVPPALDRAASILQQLLTEPASMLLSAKETEKVTTNGTDALQQARERQEALRAEVASSREQSELAKAAAREAHESELQSAQRLGEVCAWQLGEQKLHALRRAKAPCELSVDASQLASMPAVAVLEDIVGRVDESESDPLCIGVQEPWLPTALPSRLRARYAVACSLEAKRSSMDLVAAEWMQEAIRRRQVFASLGKAIAKDDTMVLDHDTSTAKALDVEREVRQLAVQVGERKMEVRRGRLRRVIVEARLAQTEQDYEVLQSRSRALQETVTAESNASAEVKRLEDEVEKQTDKIQEMERQAAKCQELRDGLDRKLKDHEENFRKEIGSLEMQQKEADEELAKLQAKTRKYNQESDECQKELGMIRTENQKFNRQYQAEVTESNEKLQRLKDQFESVSAQQRSAREEHEAATKGFSEKQKARQKFIVAEEEMLANLQQRLLIMEAGSQHATTETAGAEAATTDQASGLLPAASPEAASGGAEEASSLLQSEASVLPSAASSGKRSLAEEQQVDHGSPTEVGAELAQATPAEEERPKKRRKRSGQQPPADGEGSRKRRSSRKKLPLPAWQKGRWIRWQRHQLADGRARELAEAEPVGGAPSPTEDELVPSATAVVDTAP